MAGKSKTGIGSEVQANFLFEALVGAKNATLPDIDLFDAAHSLPWDANSPIFAPVEKISITELMAQFHTMMGGVAEELVKEHNAQRITGAKYADTYLAMTQVALQGAIQFALGKDQAFWMAAKTQADAIASHNQNEVIRLQAMLSRANYALTKLKLSSEDSAFGASEYQRLSMLPAQKSMVDEQKEAQRAQTSDSRSDDLFVGGLMKRQMDLYTQQKQSYIEDTKIKATKIFSDLWVTQKTFLETVQPPTAAAADGGQLNAIFNELSQTAQGT
jgi:hypothetical protein